MTENRPDGALMGTPTSGRTGKVTYCAKCKRIEGVGCVCGVPFAERVRGVAPQVPDHMRAVPRGH